MVESGRWSQSVLLFKEYFQNCYMLQTVSIFKPLTFYHLKTVLTPHRKKKNFEGKGLNAGKLKLNCTIWATMKLSFASAFNLDITVCLDKGNDLSSGKGLIFFPYR